MTKQPPFFFCYLLLISSSSFSTHSNSHGDDSYLLISPLSVCPFFHLRVCRLTSQADIGSCLASFSSQIHSQCIYAYGNVLCFVFSFCFPGNSSVGDRRGSSVSVVRREVLRIPSSSVEVKSHFSVSFLYFLSLIIVAVETKQKKKNDLKLKNTWPVVKRWQAKTTRRMAIVGPIRFLHI